MKKVCPRKLVQEGARRPWMLGTSDIPPPLRVPWQMWSNSDDPHEQGLVQFEFTEEGLGIGWYPDAYFSKEVIPWHELAWEAGKEHPDLKREREWLKEQSQTEGYRLGMERAVGELTRKIWSIEASSPENPFLKKYAADLTRVIDEVKQIILAMGK